MYWIARLYIQAGIIWGGLRLLFLVGTFALGKQAMAQQGVTLTVTPPGTNALTRNWHHVKVALFGFALWPLSIWGAIRSIRGVVTALRMGLAAGSSGMRGPEQLIDLLKETATLAAHCGRCAYDGGAPCACPCEECVKVRTNPPTITNTPGS